MVIQGTITTMAATDNTTRRSEFIRDFFILQKSSRMNSLLHIFVIILVSATVLYLAYPRLHASLLYLPVDTAISNYRESRSVPDEQLDGLQQRAQEAIEVHPHYRYWDGLSLLYYLEGIDAGNTLFQRRQAIEQSIEAAIVSLQRAPSQPRAWFRIAAARAWLMYPARKIIDPLLMAVYTGRVDPSLSMARLELGIAYLARMDEEGISLMRDQALLAWQLQPGAMSRALKSGSLPLTSIESLLGPAHGSVLVEIKESIGVPVR
jgi:hypothetical protein